MTLNQLIYNAIFEKERVSAYKIYEEFWYVIRWNKQTFIHYTYRQSKGTIIIHYYLCASILAPKWPCQTQELTVNTINPKKEVNSPPE